MSFHSIVIETPFHRCETKITLPQQVNTPDKPIPDVYWIGQKTSYVNGVVSVEKDYVQTKEEPLFTRRVEEKPQISSRMMWTTLLIWVEILVICICIAVFG